MGYIAEPLGTMLAFNYKYEPNALHAMMQVAYQNRRGKNSHTNQ